MRKLKIASAVLAGIIGITAIMPVHADTQEQIAVMEAQKQEARDSLSAAQERISGLEGQLQDMQDYLSELNYEYEELTANVEEMALKAGEKEEELKQVKIQLQRAKIDQLEQYESMKLRLSYIYEHGETSWLETLLSAKNLADFLDRAEYVIKISEYDRKMLEKYEETQNQIAEKEAQIQEEIEEINRIREEGSQRRQELRDMVSSASESISSYAQQITSGKEEAQQLMEQISASEQGINALTLVAAQEMTVQETSEQEISQNIQNTDMQEASDWQTEADMQETSDWQTGADTQWETSSEYPEGYNPDEDTLDSFSVAVSTDVTVEIEDSSDSGMYADTYTQEEYTEEAVYDENYAGTEEAFQEEYTGEEYISEEDSTGEEYIYEEDYTQDDIQETGYEDTQTSDSSQGTYLGTFTLTAYCGCEQCCGAVGQATASGVMPVAGHTVAMAGVPFGTQLLINGTVYTVEDLGTPYGHVDIYFDSHAAALAFGLQSAEVYQLN